MSGRPQTGSAIALRRILYAMLLGVVVYGSFAVWRGLDRLGSELARFHWWAFGAACGLALANYGVRWLKWEFYLARLEIRVLFEELATRWSSVDLVAPAERLRSNFISGIKTLPIRVTWR